MHKFSICLLGVSVLWGCTTEESGSARADGDVAVATAAAKVHPGKEVYENYCFSCHASGLSGAPRLGDVDAWQPRIAKGQELLLQVTIDGIPPAMPPRGICFDCSDAQLAEAIDYMIVESR